MNGAAGAYLKATHDDIFADCSQLQFMTTCSAQWIALCSVNIGDKQQLYHVTSRAN
jgi:hypothetical protein